MAKHMFYVFESAFAMHKLLERTNLSHKRRASLEIARQRSILVLTRISSPMFYARHTKQYILQNSLPETMLVKRMNSKAQINSLLPDEVLLQIFASAEFYRPLTFVCKRWRYLCQFYCMRMPELNKNKIMKSLAVVVMFKLIKMPLLLSTSANFVEYCDDTISSEFFKFLVDRGFCENVRFLNIRNAYWSPKIYISFESLLQGCPNLEKLCIQGRYDYISVCETGPQFKRLRHLQLLVHESSVISQLSYVMNTQNLEYLYVETSLSYADLGTDFKSLRGLTLKFDTVDANELKIRFDFVSAICEHCKSTLESVSLYLYDTEDVTVDLIKQAMSDISNLPRLKRISLEFWHHSSLFDDKYDPLQTVFENCKQLERITILKPSDTPISCYASKILASNASTLREFQILECDSQDDSVLKVKELREAINTRCKVELKYRNEELKNLAVVGTGLVINSSS